MLFSSFLNDTSQNSDRRSGLGKSGILVDFGALIPG